MAPLDEQKAAITNRSLRTIRTELEFLTDSSVITPQQLAHFLSQLPQQTVLHAPLSSPELAPAKTGNSLSSPPVSHLADQLNKSAISEKSDPILNRAPSPGPPPPAYVSTAAVATASALYEYHPTDAGDLAILPNDRIFITEFMNADWAKGRNDRTGLEGIFPRSYVAIIDEKNKMAAPVLPQRSGPSSYGHMPLEVSQSGAMTPGNKSKFEEHGKKFGRKMGNAAIFGAGATIGSNIVNGIMH